MLAEVQDVTSKMSLTPDSPPVRKHLAASVMKVREKLLACQESTPEFALETLARHFKLGGRRTRVAT